MNLDLACSHCTKTPCDCPTGIRQFHPLVPTDQIQRMAERIRTYWENHRTMIQSIRPRRNENPGTVPPWLAKPDQPITLPDPIADDTPRILPTPDSKLNAIDGWLMTRG